MGDHVEGRVVLGGVLGDEVDHGEDDEGRERAHGDRVGEHGGRVLVQMEVVPCGDVDNMVAAKIRM